MAVSKSLRAEILRRDNHTCRYCGATAPDVKLTIDHVVPTTLGGSDDPTNLVAACVDCNAGKSSTPPGAPLVADVAQDAMRWAAAIKQAAENDLAGSQALVDAADDVATIFRSVIVPSYRGGGTLFDYVPLDWDVSIEKFLTGGLRRDEIAQAARRAASARKVYADKAFNYFCGICWSKLRERQEAARAIVATEEVDEPLSQYDFNTWNDGYDAGRRAAEKAITGQDWYALGIYGLLSHVTDGPR